MKKLLLTSCFLSICSLVINAQSLMKFTQSENGRGVNNFPRNVSTWRTGYFQQTQSAVSSLPALIKASLIRNADTSLNFQFPDFTQDQFLEYSRTGNRHNFEIIYLKKRNVLANLVLAEAIQQQGKYLPQIVAGVMSLMREATWTIPAHMSFQNDSSPLPVPGKKSVEIYTGETASELAWISFLLGSKIDGVKPGISKNIAEAIDSNFINPYISSNYTWMKWTSNFNPWINRNFLFCLALLPQSDQTITSGLDKCFGILDTYLNSYPDDGSNDEGPRYWGVSSNYIYEFIDILSQISTDYKYLLSLPKVEKMGEYLQDVHIANSFYLDYGDANARELPQVYGLYNFAKATQNKSMTDFATFAINVNPANLLYCNNLSDYCYGLSAIDEIYDKKVAPTYIKNVWFPRLQLFISRQNADTSAGFYLAAMGSNNGRNHGHNDAGNFTVYVDGNPLLIDIGSGTYKGVAKGEVEWFKQSEWHNLPQINGTDEGSGKTFQATQVTIDSGEANSLSTELSTAFPPEAAVTSWKRTVSLKNQQVTLNESFKFQSSGKSAFKDFILTPGNVSMVKDGQIKIEYDSTNHRSVFIDYPAGAIVVSLENRIIDDPYLVSIWKVKSFTRIAFSNKTQATIGEIKLLIHK